MLMAWAAVVSAETGEETRGECLRDLPSARLSLGFAKWCYRLETPIGVPSSITMSETRLESRGAAAAKAEECTKANKRMKLVLTGIS